MDDEYYESMFKMISETTEKLEWGSIGSIIPSLLKKGCLTDIECRIIASTKNLSERKCAIYDMIMSKTDVDALKLIMDLRTSTNYKRAKENSVLQNSKSNQKDHNNSTSSVATNPFLNNTVIKNLYAFLSLKDIKNCRLVCRQWNSTAEICLRKRSQIHFRRNVLEPSTFLEISRYSLPDLPYLAFKFSSEDLAWSIAEIQEFFDRYGKNIKELRLEGVILTDGLRESEMGFGMFLPSYDVSPWIANCTDIAILKIDSHKNNNATPLRISLDKLASIKTIALRKCRIIIDTENENTRIAPNAISFSDVSIKRAGVVLLDYCYHDFLNLNQTKNAVLLSTVCRLDLRYPKLDMKSQVININRLYLANVELENWVEAKGEVQLLHFQGIDFVQKTQLKIKELVVLGLHVIDLSALPQTIEKLKLLQNNEIICTSEPIQLPNIKYLLFDIVDNNSHLLTHFTNCPHLAELELNGCDDAGKLYLSCIPRTVKKVKLNCVHIKFVDYYTLDLETLILEDNKHISGYSDFVNIITKMKAKNLVVVVTKKTQLPAADIIRLVEENNNQSQKIIVGSSNDFDLLKETDFERSAFSGYVDRKSNYYLFENKIGKAIPRMHFDRFKILDEINLK